MVPLKFQRETVVIKRTKVNDNILVAFKVNL